MKRAVATALILAAGCTLAWFDLRSARATDSDAATPAPEYYLLTAAQIEHIHAIIARMRAIIGEQHREIESRDREITELRARAQCTGA